MWPNSQGTVDLVTFTEKILYGKFHFLCCGWCTLRYNYKSLMKVYSSRNNSYQNRLSLWSSENKKFSTYKGRLIWTIDKGIMSKPKYKPKICPTQINPHLFLFGALSQWLIFNDFLISCNSVAIKVFFPEMFWSQNCLQLYFMFGGGLNFAFEKILTICIRKFFLPKTLPTGILSLLLK